VGDPPDCSVSQTPYDYSREITLVDGSPAGPGLKLRNSASNGTAAGTGCRQALPPPVGAGPLSGTFGPVPGAPDTDSVPSQTFHKWVSPPLPAGYDVIFDGTGAFDLWTKTVNNAVEPGNLCIYLFYRHQVNGQTFDTPVVNLAAGNTSYFNYTPPNGDNWPTSWQPINIPLTFALTSNVSGQTTPLELTAGMQLGVAIMVDGSATGAGGLEFMYDDPTFDSRVILDTHSAVPTF
jgi:hypothetical protein